MSVTPGSVAAQDVESLLHPYSNLTFVREQGPEIGASGVAALGNRTTIPCAPLITDFRTQHDCG